MYTIRENLREHIVCKFDDIIERIKDVLTISRTCRIFDKMLIITAEDWANRDIEISTNEDIEISTRMKISDLIISNTIVTFHTWWFVLSYKPRRSFCRPMWTWPTVRSNYLMFTKWNLPVIVNTQRAYKVSADYRTRACSSVFLGNSLLLPSVSYIFVCFVTRNASTLNAICFVRFRYPIRLLFLMFPALKFS